MLRSKLIEIRDRSTRIDALVVDLSRSNNKLSKEESRYLHHNGYGMNNHVLLSRLDNSETRLDPYKWASESYPNRTMVEAHKYLQSIDFDSIPNCWVIDVETILGEKDTMKVPERYSNDGVIRFHLNSRIEFSDIDATIEILKNDYKLGVAQFNAPDLFHESVQIMIDKESIINSGKKFYEVLAEYLVVIGG